MDSLPGFRISLPCSRLTMELRTKDRRLRDCYVTSWGWITPSPPKECPFAWLHLIDDPTIGLLVHRMRIFRPPDPLFAELNWRPGQGEYGYIGSLTFPPHDKRAVMCAFGWLEAARQLARLGRPPGSGYYESRQALEKDIQVGLDTLRAQGCEITQVDLASELGLSRSRFSELLKEHKINWKTIKSQTLPKNRRRR
jgi:hypothetical protein